ncbi:MAG: hypothetical protein WCY74_06740, partial [Sphaerochaetaceae bacterium]
MERMKMPRQNRAPQFAPFDALKGLHEALRLAEYEHERIVKGEISEEQADVVDTANGLLLREANEILKKDLLDLLKVLKDKALKYKNIPC